MNETLAWPGEPETAAAAPEWPGQVEETPGTPEQEQKRANPVDLFSYHVATNGIGAVQGLLRGLQSIASDSAKEKVLQDSIDGLQKYKAETLPQYYGVTSEDLKSTASKVAGAGAAVSDIAAGPALMISKMAGQTYGDTYAAAEQQIRAGGETNEEMIRDKAREQARNSIFKMAPTLLAYGLGGQVAAKGAELILPEAAGPLARFAVGTGTSAAANLAVSGTTRVIEGQPVTGDLQQNLTDVFFGAAGGVHAALHTWPGKAEQPVAVADSERVLTPDEVKVITPGTAVPRALPDRAAITASPDVETAPIIPAEIAQTQSAIAAREEMLANSVDAGERQAIANEIVGLRGQLAGQQRAHDEAAAFENAWSIIPPATRERMALDLRSRGIPEERIAAMTPEEARTEIARGAAETVATTEASGSATEPRQLSEEEMARRDWENEMLQQMDEAQAGQGRDLLDAIVRSGGLPSKESPARQHYAGELADIESAVRDPNRKAGSAVSPIDLFRKDAPGLDTLATNLRDHGFDVQTPDDLLQLLDQRIRKGRPIYGIPELAMVMDQPGYYSVAENYAKGHNLPPEKIEEARNGIARTLQLAASPSLARVYEGVQTELFDPGRAAVAAEPAQKPRGRTERSAAASREGLAGLEQNDPARVNRALAENQNRVSILLHDLVNHRIPQWDIKGAVITSPADFAATVQSIRSPFFETLKIAIIDRNHRVVTSQIVGVGTLNEAIAHPREIMRVAATLEQLKKQTKANRIIVSHNHPSGDVSPSQSDHGLHNRWTQAAELAGMEIIDHIITNGVNFFSFRGMGIDTLPQPTKAAWELMRQQDMPKIDSPEKMQALVGTLRTADPTSSHIIYVGTRFNMLAIERVSGGDNYMLVRKAMVRGIGREGAYAVLLDIASGKQHGGAIAEESAHTSAPHHTFQRLKEVTDLMQVKLLDATWAGMTSAKEAGLLEEPGKYGTAKVQEEAPPWRDKFPEVTIHTNVATLRRHSQFAAAKAGDVHAAHELVSDLVKPDKIAAIARAHPKAIVTYVHAEEQTGRNKIPSQFALSFEDHGLEVDGRIVQTNRVYHTDAPAVGRLLKPPTFSGPVEAGREYIIVDDVTTSGSSLAGLRHYIEANGGKVVDASTLATTSSGTTGYGGRLAIRPETEQQLKNKFGGPQLNDILQRYGIASSIGHLTNSQGRYLASFRSLDAIRNRITEAGFTAGPGRGAPPQSAAAPTEALRTDSGQALDTGRQLGRAPVQLRLLEQSPQFHAMATGAGPHRATPRPAAPTPAPTPIVAAAAGPVKSWWQQRTLGIRKIVAPQTIDAPARAVANIIRDYNGQVANTIIRADHALASARSDFDRTPVPRSWKYDPNKALPRNYAFIDNSERGGAGLSTQDRQLKAQVDQMFSDAIDEVHRVKPAALQDLIQNYFPHIWEDPEQAKRVFAEIVSKRPLEGPKGFLKKRVLEYTIDGLKAGLRPVSDNPVDMVLTKLHEVHRFVAAQDMLREAKAIGARKFVYVYEKAPEGWVKVEDPTSTVHGPPFVTVPEAFDEQMRAKTIELLDKLGVPHERLRSLGGTRWGEAEKSPFAPRGLIRTKFAGPLSVYWHELGHVLQYRYGWIDQIAHDAKRANLGGKSTIEKELRALADLHIPQAGTTPGFKKYIRTKDEKAATMLEVYVHAPDRMKSTAPLLYGRVRKFIADHPELKAIDEIRPNLPLGVAKAEIPVNGMVTLGHYYMPEGAAQVFSNYLSPGLQRFGIIRSIRQSTNILSGLQLGFSAFHAGFTSIDAAVSQFALGLRYLSEGKPITALGKIVTTPAAPLTNYLLGKRVQRAMTEPGSGGARIQQIADLAVKAGLRATVDPFWRTQITRNMIRAWHEGGAKGMAGTVLRLPFAMSEQLMRPILEYLVPRQKLGVFAGMAEAHINRLGPAADIHAVRDAMARAADATEDRMGQMTYDNLFYNRVVRDAALLGFRAYGWTYGKYRALFGGVADILQTPGRVRAGGPVLSDRMAYLIALPMVAAGIGSVMNYWMTGEAPQDWKDALMPRTGRLDRHGNPQRLSLPTYIKDLLSDWHDFPRPGKMFTSFYHKLNPGIDVAVDIIRNADFFGTQVYNEDDPHWKQVRDASLFAMKSATPFSITSAAKLRESDPSLAQQVLPFFGFVPAKAELSMTPAQVRASELMYATLPRGSRPPDKAEQSKMIALMMRDMKEQNRKWQGEFAGALSSGQIQPNQIGRLFQSLPLSPFQYQVKKLGPEDAMKVWDLADGGEKQQIRAIILMKLSNAKTLPAEQRTRWIQLILSER